MTAWATSAFHGSFRLVVMLCMTASIPTQTSCYHGMIDASTSLETRESARPVPVVLQACSDRGLNKKGISPACEAFWNSSLLHRDLAARNVPWQRLQVRMNWTDAPDPWCGHSLRTLSVACCEPRACFLALSGTAVALWTPKDQKSRDPRNHGF